MELAYKQDMDKVLARFEAWWHNEMLDRPLVTIFTKSDKQPKLPQSQHASDRDRWMDVEYQLDCFEAALEGKLFLGETVPHFQPNLGPDLVATLFGAELEFGGETSWVHPIAESCRQISQWQPNFEGVYWQRMRELTDASLRRGAGKWLTGLTDLHTNGDLLSAMRDPGQLCIELFDDIEGVREACDHVTSFYPQMFDDLYDRIAAAGDPLTTWTPIVHPGRAYMTSCDFACLISPDMFAQSILPGIQAEMAFLDRSCFHLDGEGSLNHLDCLLESDDLDAIAWVYGAGNEPATKWMDVYKKIQAAGKAIQVTPEDFDIARELVEELKPEGLWLWFEESGPHDQKDVEDFIAWLDKR